MRFAQLVSPDHLALLVGTADSMSEWSAFRHLCFPGSILREADPKGLQDLQRAIGQTLAEAEREKGEEDPSASGQSGGSQSGPKSI